MVPVHPSTVGGCEKRGCRTKRHCLVSVGSSSSSEKGQRPVKAEERKKKQHKKIRKYEVSIHKDKKVNAKKKKHNKKKSKCTKKVRRKKRATVSSFSSSSAESVHEDCATRFSQLAERGDVHLAQYLLKRFGLEWTSAQGDNALHIAARLNQVGLVAWILGQADFPQWALDTRNCKGETPLLVATRLCRGAAALRLVEALADPGIADNNGESPEVQDLDGLLRETEWHEACTKRAEQERVLAVVATARGKREEARWQERLLYESGLDEYDNPFMGYEDLERQDLESARLHWMDEIEVQVQERKRKEERQQMAERLRAMIRTQEDARIAAEEQERRARAAAEADAANTRKAAAAGTTCVQPSLDMEEARASARALDDGRWRALEERLGCTAAKEPLKLDDIPWPSGLPENPIHIDPGGHPAVVRSQLRAGLLRWHPDKFAQRFGSFFSAGGTEFESALARVKAIAQQLNRLNAELNGVGRRSGSVAEGQGTDA